MSKIILIFLILFVFIDSSFGQSRKKYKWRSSFAVTNIYSPMGLIGDATIGLSTDGFWNGGGEKKDNSYSISIISKYLLSKDFLLSFEFGITAIDEKRKLTVTSTTGSLTSPTYPITNENIQQMSFRFIPSFQLIVYDENKIEVHIGISVPYMNYSNLTYNIESESHSTTNDSLVFKNILTRNVPGGFGIGIGAVAGFDYYIFRKLSLGAEFSNAFMYYDIGGNVEDTRTILYPTDVAGSGTAIIPETYKGMRLEKIFSSFLISFHF